MTRIALLADIHGHLPALESVMADMKQFAPDHVVVAGDLVNWGPFSAEVLQIATEYRWTIIRGNNEFYSINANPPRRPASWGRYTLLGWLHDQLADWHYVVAGLPDDLLLLYPDAPDVHLCHGIPNDPWIPLYPAQFTPDATALSYLQNARATTIFCGHTHIAMNRHVGAYHIINPGPVGVPVTGEHVSSYMILDGDADGWHVTAHRKLPIDTERLFPAWEAQHFIERCGPTAVMVIEEFKQARMMVHCFNMWMAETYPDEPQTLARAEEFLHVDPERYTSAPYKAPQPNHVIG